MKAARAICQNGIAVNISRHRSTLRRSTPTSSVRRRRRAAVAPSRRIAITIIVAARYALGPRKRRDGGILRLRQPVSCATQAEPPIVLGRQAAKPTAEFAGIVGRMHGAPAQQAASSPHLVG